MKPLGEHQHDCRVSAGTKCNHALGGTKLSIYAYESEETYQVFIMVKCPTKTCVHAKAPPSGGGPGSFQLAVLLVRDRTLRLLSLIVSSLIVSFLIVSS